MYTTVIALGALLTSSVLGASIPAASKAALARRQMEQPAMSWINDEAGNLTFVVSDETISYGSVDPKTVLEGLYDQCWTSGVCDPSSFTKSG